jgi:tetratricopeptide (TPR) repeat protein
MLSVKRMPRKSHVRKRGVGVELRPGAVKQARKEVGLSLAQVAGNQISKAAIHLIEMGKSRPSMRTLELIAASTQKPLSFFLAGAPPTPGIGVGGLANLQLRNLERLAIASEFGELRDACRTLVEQPLDPRSEAYSRYYLGRAQVGLLEAAEAAENLVRARALFQKLGDGWMAVECLDWHAWALHINAQPEALPLAMQALNECRGLAPVPILTEAQILTHVAVVHDARNEPDVAIEYYSAALVASKDLLDPSRLGDFYWELGAVYQKLGDLDGGSSYANKALASYRTRLERDSVASAERLLGSVLLRHGQVSDAEEHLGRSLAIFEELKDDRGRSRALHDLADLHIATGEFADAQRFADLALTLSKSLGEDVATAAAHQLRGRIADSEGQPERSDREFETAIEILETAGAFEQLADCYAQYASILEARGSTGEAIAYWKKVVAVGRPELLKHVALRTASPRNNRAVSLAT